MIAVSNFIWWWYGIINDHWHEINHKKCYSGNIFPSKAYKAQNMLHMYQKTLYTGTVVEKCIMLMYNHLSNLINLTINDHVGFFRMENESYTYVYGPERISTHRYSPCSTVSSVRRTFCLIALFDLCFCFILWVIYTQVRVKVISRWRSNYTYQ